MAPRDVPRFIREDVPFLGNQEHQDQDQDQDQNPNPNQNPNGVPIQVGEELNNGELYTALIQVRNTVVQNLANRESAGQNGATNQERFDAYSQLLNEFASAVDRKLALDQQPHTAETAMQHIAINEQITRLIRDICEFYDRYMSV